MLSWRSKIGGAPGVVVALAANGAARLVISLLVGRLAGPAALGLYQSGFSAAQLAALIWPAAVGSAASAYLAKALGKRDEDMLGEVTAHLTKRTIQSTLIILCVASAIWAAVSDSSVFDVVAFAVLVASVCAYAFARGRLYGLGEIRRAVVWDVVTSVLAVGLSTIALALGADVSVVLLCAAANYAVFATFTWPRRWRVRTSRSTAVELDKFTVFAVLGTIANSGLLQASVLVSGAVAGRTGAGQFSAAFVLATPMTLMSTGVAMVLFPRLAHAVGRNDAEGLRSIADRTTRLLTLIMIPAFGSAIILRYVIVDVVWGATFAEAARVLPFMLFALLLTSLAIPAVNTISSHSSGGARLSASFTLIGVAVCCASWPLLIPALGIRGVAAGYMIGTVVSAGIPYAVVWRRTHQQWSPNTLRIGVAVGMIVAVMILQDRVVDNVGFAVTMTASFLVVWAAINWPEVRGYLRPDRA